jgi:signal transduction histidine kinase
VAADRLSWSEMLCALYGVAPADAPTTVEAYLALVHPDDRERARVVIERAFAARRAFAFDHRVVRPDGAVRLLHGRGDVEVGPGGAVVRLVGTAQDVTEPRAAAAERGRLTRELTDLLESITDPLYEYDRGWRLVRCNSAGRAVLVGEGHDGDALIGRTLWEMFPGLDALPLGRALRRAMDERIPLRFEEPHVRLDGWVEVHAYPTGIGLATYTQDVSERRRGQERLRVLAEASEVLSRSLDLETTLRAVAELPVPELADWCFVEMVEPGGAIRPVAAHHVDPELRALAWRSMHRWPIDPEAPFGTGAVVRTGRPEVNPDIPQELLASVARDDEHLAVLRRVGLRSSLSVPLQVRGETIGVLSLASSRDGLRYGQAELDMARELARRAAAAIDNARLYAAERAARAAAEEANRAKMQFLATMSHELRTPLNAIGGYAELLELEIRGPVTGEQREDLARIQRSQRHLLGLINDVLNFAKLEAGHVAVAPERLPLVLALSRLEQLVAPLVAAKALRYEAEVPDGLAAHADPDKVSQVLVNLLSNAVKFTPAGGWIRVCARADGAAVRLRVEDSGPGIPAERRAQVFEPFVQLDRTLSNPHEGTGLGLAISRELARAMGGELTAGEAAGGGAAFELVLPQAAT